VLAYAGADLCLNGACRDNVDTAIMEDVRTCDVAPVKFDVAWPSKTTDAWGFAKFTPSAAPADRDNDGMPDAWESQYTSTNPAVFDANADADGDGYPNIEEYLNYLAQDHVRYSGFIGSGTGTLPKYNCGRAMFP
jgi:hypothetical protein